MSLVIVGDLLLDRDVLGSVDRLCPEAPVPVLVESSIVDRPGGAGLAAQFAATLDGAHDVVLVAAVSDDEAARWLRNLLASAGIRLVGVPLLGPTPQKVRLRTADHLLLRLDRGDKISPIGAPPVEALEAISKARAVLVSDYGRGLARQRAIRGALAAAARRVPVVWDPHPRGGSPVPGVRLATPNRGEAARLAGERSAGAAADWLREHWSAGAVAVTLGERGAVVADGLRPPRIVSPPLIARGDPCGAGDRFASAAVLALAGGAALVEAVQTAVDAATAYVARGGALTFLPELDNADLDNAQPELSAANG
jgi:D-beta-D-heptose 7-phosphate kinase / D-beta-D-heptose 1-phosphate adenosyltransferase